MARWSDIADRYTPVERSDQRWRAQVTSVEEYVATAGGQPQQQNYYLLPPRTERIQLAIISNSHTPIIVKPDQTGSGRLGITLWGFGDMVVFDAIHDSELVISAWYIYADGWQPQEFTWIETWRDVQMDRSE